MIQRGALRIDPIKNPAILDTGTWDRENARKILATAAESTNTDLFTVPPDGGDGKNRRAEVLSTVRRDGLSWSLLRLADGQRVFASRGRSNRRSDIGDPLHEKKTGDTFLACYPTDYGVIDAYRRTVDPAAGPRALGAVPRLGVGCRQSVAVWPGIWRAVSSGGFAVNAIQNSLRELNLLEELKAGARPRSNYQFSFGTVQEGHTGSTFEGLWTEGVLSAIASMSWPRYGADADHIMVKRTPGGIERAKNIIDAARYYSFYTLDVSDLLDYQALNAGRQESFERVLPDTDERRGVVQFHRIGRRVAGVEYRPDEEELAGLYGKYGQALDAAEELHRHIVSLKKGEPFDLELSIDENPPEVNTCENLTSVTELLFLLLESDRRGIPFSHIAPNLGVEKGIDYRCGGGLDELGSRLEVLHRIATCFGVMIDCHSGDDLSAETRRAIGRATDGRIHFKISPSLQVLFGKTLFDLDPESFQYWWNDTLAYAKAEAAQGSAIAASALRELNKGNGRPDPVQPVFHHFSFGTLGKRNDENRFISREWFYELPGEIYDEYTKRVESFLLEVAGDVFG